ncbi:MAG: KH domain-containing protein [Actinomycetota bacterium]|nr:KH domain-containing protein [Actinomycetota bacterium]
MSAPTAAAVLEHVVRSIVDQPDAVSVEVTEDGDRTRLDVRVGDGDLGRVIGRRGRTAASIRTVTRAAAANDGVEVDIEFLDD